MKIKRIGLIFAGLLALCYTPAVKANVLEISTDEANATVSYYQDASSNYYLSGYYISEGLYSTNVIKYLPNGSGGYDRDTNFAADSSVAPDTLTFDTTQGNWVLVVGSVRINAGNGSFRESATTPVHTYPGYQYHTALNSYYWNPFSPMITYGGGALYYCIPGVTGWIPVSQATLIDFSGSIPYYLAVLCDNDHDGNATDTVGRLQINYTLFYAPRI